MESMKGKAKIMQALSFVSWSRALEGINLGFAMDSNTSRYVMCTPK
jgi:hypothetical protein